MTVKVTKYLFMKTRMLLNHPSGRIGWLLGMQNNQNNKQKNKDG